MKKGAVKLLNIALLTLAAAVIILGALSLWLYSGSLTAAKNKIFQAVPLPMAFVNWQSVPMKDFIASYQLAEKLNIPQAGESNQQLRQNIYSRLISDAETGQVAVKYDVFVGQNQIEAEYLLRSGRADLQGQKNFSGLLASYGLTEAEYKNQVIKPQLLLQNLQIWFNSQKSLNAAQYAEANSLVQKIQNGADMGALAQEYTQDPGGQSVQGDLGFVQLTDILPELREPVDEMPPGSVKIIPSQFGLNIIRLEQKTGNLYHLREIFLDMGDFNKWFSSQTQNFKIKKLLNI